MKQIWVPDLSLIARWLWSKCRHRFLDLLLILLLIYAVFMRNISIAIYVDSNQWSLSQSAASLPVRLSAADQSDLDGTVFMNEKKPLKQINKNKIEVKKTAIPVIKKETKPAAPKEKDNKANHYSNIAFIINPDLSRKADRQTVETKMKTCRQYAQRYSAIAQVEQKKYGIPASITLAQGILESDAAGSKLAKNNNNHFGVKCFSRRCKKGHCSNFTDDTHKDFFRIYKNVWESYRDHSRFLQNSRYRHLQKLGRTDYKNWAYGLRKAGYATDKHYAEKIIRIIEALELYQYD